MSAHYFACSLQKALVGIYGNAKFIVICRYLVALQPQNISDTLTSVSLSFMLFLYVSWYAWSCLQEW